MSNRSTRKARNKGKNLTFKQCVHLGMTHKKLVLGEINYNDVPQWMRDVAGTDKRNAELNATVQLEVDEAAIAVAPEAVVQSVVPAQHVHGENCNHE